MDVIYSMTCHEDPDSFLDLIKNIKYFNKDLKICIIVHANDYMFKQLQGKIEHLNPIHYNRTLNTIDFFKSHIENYDYCIKNQIDMKYFIPLASNCYFHKFVKLEYLDELINQSLPPTPIEKVNWHWPSILLNKKININVGELYCHQHEGVILSKEIGLKISEHCKKYDIFNNVEINTLFEEYLYASLYSKFTGKSIQTLCKVFWDEPGYSPTLPKIINCETPCVKRVSRNYNDPVRIYFRNLTNNYENTS
jgi:hypothetical protein